MTVHVRHHSRMSLLATMGGSAERQGAPIKDRALTGLKEKLVSADAVAETVRTYHEAMNREKQDQRAQSSADRHTLAKVERTIKSIITAIEDGMYQPSMKARMDDLEHQKAEITARIAAETPPLPDVNPNIAEIYRHKVQHLSVALADPTTAQEATTAIRSLIGEIVPMTGG
jgi:site-specific DNA recombinase